MIVLRLIVLSTLSPQDCVDKTDEEAKQMLTTIAIQLETRARTQLHVLVVPPGVQILWMQGVDKTPLEGEVRTGRLQGKTQEAESGDLVTLSPLPSPLSFFLALFLYPVLFFLLVDSSLGRQQRI